jgi:alanyl-tRNA synthetase
MTKKLYYMDPYLNEFTAKVIKKEEYSDGWKIQLDETAFYPEGGGQPADKGTLDSLEVVDVQKENDTVIHFLKEVPAKDIVSGIINWEHRFDYMQLHTGQHILSAVLNHLLGASTVAVHQAEDYTSIEIDLLSVSDQDLLSVEKAANEMVCTNLPVFTYFNGDRPISDFPLRRETKFTENVRLVQVGGLSLENSEIQDIKNVSPDNTSRFRDLAACGGIHTARTGEVGLIKFTGQEKVRGRIRLFWLIGERAYDDYRKKTAITDKIGKALSVPLLGIESEFDRLSSSISAEKKKTSDLVKEMAFLKAEEIKNDTFNEQSAVIFNDADPEYFKQIIISLSSFKDISVCLLNIKGSEGQWALISTGDNPIDFNHFRNEMLPMIQGRGGGKTPLWQGKIGNSSSIEKFREKFSNTLS